MSQHGTEASICFRPVLRRDGVSSYKAISPYSSPPEPQNRRTAEQVCSTGHLVQAAAGTGQAPDRRTLVAAYPRGGYGSLPYERLSRILPSVPKMVSSLPRLLAISLPRAIASVCVLNCPAAREAPSLFVYQPSSFLATKTFCFVMWHHLLTCRTPDVHRAYLALI